MPEPHATSDRRRAIFLDRDGTINEDVGYPSHPDEISIYPYAAEAIRLLNEAGLKTIIVTNQAGVARGYLDETMLARIHEHLTVELARQGARIDAIYYCPHHPQFGDAPYRKTCDCRKPQPGMLHRAAREHSVDLAASYVIGDKASDINLASNAGARGVLVKTGYGEMTWERIQDSGFRIQRERSQESGVRSQNTRFVNEAAADDAQDSRLKTHQASLIAPHLCQPHLVAENLLEAVRLILTEVRAVSRD